MDFQARTRADSRLGRGPCQDLLQYIEQTGGHPNLITQQLGDLESLSTTGTSPHPMFSGSCCGVGEAVHYTGHLCLTSCRMPHR